MLIFQTINLYIVYYLNCVNLFTWKKFSLEMCYDLYKVKSYIRKIMTSCMKKELNKIITLGQNSPLH